MCPEYFFLMLFFCGYRACYCSSSSSSYFRSSPVYGFPGRPPGGAGCRERSQRSCLRPSGFPPLTRNPGLQRPFRSRRLCRAVACAPGIPAKRHRDVRRNAVSRTRFTSLRLVPAHCLPGATHPYESLSPGADTATTCRTDCPG
ncbi:bifunctional aconitate hydratase 2/2-methylisocitrate dehydratase (plasmid) [Escherichia coli]|nr:bifunctional aconitate hydratase 2/2-methylisocitrate dehydratase [Escherichia coli]